MRHPILTTLCACGLLALAGCSSDHIISTNDGRLIESESKPVVDEDTGMIRYEDQEGEMNQIPQSDVKEIRER